MKINDGLYCFNGELVEHQSRYIDANKEGRRKALWEGLIDYDVPILARGMFPTEEPYSPSNKFFEGLGFLWGSISFHVGLSRTILGKITNI